MNNHRARISRGPPKTFPCSGVGCVKNTASISRTSEEPSTVFFLKMKLETLDFVRRANAFFCMCVHVFRLIFISALIEQEMLFFRYF
jgi:hypothetical protein